MGRDTATATGTSTSSDRYTDTKGLIFRLVAPPSQEYLNVHLQGADRISESVQSVKSLRYLRGLIIERGLLTSIRTFRAQSDAGCQRRQ